MEIGKWDKRFLELARFISKWSKDPSTKVGAVVVGPNRLGENKRIISVGFNGFAEGVDDSEERYNNRELKYKLVVHGEQNALIFANKSVENCTLYTYPLAPCSNCASKIVQEGISRVVSPVCSADVQSRWGDDIELTKMIFKEAGVKFDLYDFDLNQ